MGRSEKEFLLGFAKAATLTQRMLAAPPAHTSPKDYMKDVAHLLRSSDDLVDRGIAVGCLAAVGDEA
jgi:hypothetical protein